VFVRTEGGWNDGVNDAVGAVSDVNGIQDGGNEIGVTHLWFQQDLLDRRVRLRLGKLDNSIDAFDFHGRAVAFDAVPYANFAGTQFLDNALVNNAAIPFPASALAFQLFVEPVERVYVATTVAQANGNKFGIDFSDIGWTFLVESGVALDLGDAGLPGQCYVGYYHADFEDAPSGEGVYVGAAQMIHREAGTDDEGLGLFVRYGYADRVPSGIRHAWSIGGQYKGLVGGRGDDVLGIAWAQAFTRDGSFSAPYEGVLEVYYRARLAPWLHVTPHVQYIANPGSNDLDDAITLGVRGQITF
jgi:porin